ncbi:glycosyl hydrolase [Grimontia sp. AD028]|uniref:glycoside hydrolase family 30 protein n=1 Tax=Grimontia sp. AD028 TaxID=1581149 RepID=UPI00061AC6BC|nr:glycoside hydrolase family 30 beta sandwich domain-containing protein [Grimontia sp. AD028]KKD60687.1 glycosyl hydrolase [Grimontia sp. AD028]
MEVRAVAAALVALSSAMLLSCTSDKDREQALSNNKNFGLTSTSEILLTSEAGDKMSVMPNQSFTTERANGIQVVIQPDITKQTITGIGTSFTESAAFVLAHLPPEKRLEVMNNLYGESGANFSLTRTPIGSTDFSVEGKLGYAEVEGDAALEHFTIAPDSDGFSKAKYPGIQDESFDVLPMIKEAKSIKAKQDDGTLNIIASAWTAPPWMKDINTWFIKGSEENDWEGTGGSLKPEYESTYADYLVKYLEHYKEAGVDIWGLTPVNEPHGNSGNWESMHFTAETQNTFIKEFLGPALKESAFNDTRLLIYDQNRDHLEHWTDVILGDPDTAPYVYGSAVHWYSSTVDVYEKVLEKVHNKFPDFAIIHTEGTIDDLGKPASKGILDPVKFQESGWFDNDEFWWNENATDWAYTATWAPNPENHPIYTPVHRYARDIIVSLNHWMNGWVDWNAVLDAKGGPNHAGNFCGAPIMIDTETGYVYYTPIYDVLAQFSRTIRPGDKAVKTDTLLGALEQDDLHASSTVNESGLLSVQLLNTTKKPIQFDLVIGAQSALITLPANALQTVRVQL